MTHDHLTTAAAYDPTLVVLSVLIAIAASTTALELTGRVADAAGRARALWLMGGAALMGLGIWAMHFLGMLAFHLPMPVRYDVPLTLASLAVAVAASGGALVVASRPAMTPGGLLLGGGLMGSAIAAMHYLGMAAMRVEGHITYQPVLVAASVVIAVAASVAALWLAFHLRGESVAAWSARRLGSAVVMGVAIAGMHYTGMAAMQVVPGDVTQAPVTHLMNLTDLDAVLIGFSTLFVLAMGLIGSYREIAHRREMRMREELARQKAELERMNHQLLAADRYKDDFLSVISHELRTPLNFIMGFGSVLEDELAGPLTATQRDYLHKMLGGADRMLHLVNDLLDFAKLHAGRLDLAVVPTAYAPLIEEVVSTMQPLADAKGVTIASQVDVLQPARVDGMRVVQVLTNLVSNAIKFTPAGGRITVRAFEQDGEVVTQVIDTGIGIAPHDIPRLFQRFQQIDMSATRQAGGTGLGLSITKALVEAQEGQVGVLSEVGRGSTFWFTVPLAPAPAGRRTEGASF